MPGAVLPTKTLTLTIIINGETFFLFLRRRCSNEKQINKKEVEEEESNDSPSASGDISYQTANKEQSEAAVIAVISTP